MRMKQHIKGARSLSGTSWLSLTISSLDSLKLQRTQLYKLSPPTRRTSPTTYHIMKTYSTAILLNLSFLMAAAANAMPEAVLHDRVRVAAPLGEPYKWIEYYSG